MQGSETSKEGTDPPAFPVSISADVPSLIKDLSFCHNTSCDIQSSSSTPICFPDKERANLVERVKSANTGGSDSIALHLTTCAWSSSRCGFFVRSKQTLWRGSSLSSLCPWCHSFLFFFVFLFSSAPSCAGFVFSALHVTHLECVFCFQWTWVLEQPLCFFGWCWLSHWAWLVFFWLSWTLRHLRPLVRSYKQRFGLPWLFACLLSLQTSLSSPRLLCLSSSSLLPDPLISSFPFFLFRVCLLFCVFLFRCRFLRRLHCTYRMHRIECVSSFISSLCSFLPLLLCPGLFVSLRCSPFLFSLSFPCFSLCSSGFVFSGACTARIEYVSKEFPAEQQATLQGVGLTIMSEWVNEWMNDQGAMEAV